MKSPQEPSAPEMASEEFAIKDCALIAIATGQKAITLKEFLSCLLDTSPGSIYYHFWGELLQPRFEEREYNNDFAGWVRHFLHDAVLAERLAVIDPTDYEHLEDLRQEVVDLVEQRLDESEYLHWTHATRQFEFIHSQIVVFDTGQRIRRPEQLADVIPAVSPSTIFYHFIDARRRSPDGTDDFRSWLRGLGRRYDPLCDRLATVDPYFGSLFELRDELAGIFAQFSGRAS